MKSFSLIEVIVAIFIITVGAGGAFALMQQNLAFSSVSSSKLTASYLAQEGIEVIRNIRDTNYLEGSAWDDGIVASTDYRLDYRSTSFPDSTCPGDHLKYESGHYVCSSDSSGKFQREISVSKPEAGKMIVSVEVSWRERGRTNKVNAETELYNWR